MRIVDTPGLVGRHRLLDRVCGKSLRLIVPSAPLRPRVYQLYPGQTIFVGGLARVDFEQGEAQSFVVYAANQLHVHRTKLARADELYRQHLGVLLTPPCPDCADDLRGLVALPVHVKGDRAVDIALPGLGWVRVGAEAKLTVHLPQGIAPVVRPAVFSSAEPQFGSGFPPGREWNARHANPSSPRAFPPAREARNLAVLREGRVLQPCAMGLRRRSGGRTLHGSPAAAQNGGADRVSKGRSGLDENG